MNAWSMKDHKKMSFLHGPFSNSAKEFGLDLKLKKSLNLQNSDDRSSLSLMPLNPTLSKHARGVHSMLKVQEVCAAQFRVCNMLKVLWVCTTYVGGLLAYVL